MDKQRLRGISLRTCLVLTIIGIVVGLYFATSLYPDSWNVGHDFISKTIQVLFILMIIAGVTGICAILGLIIYWVIHGKVE